MNFWIVSLAILCGVVLTATGLSLYALWRAHRVLHEVARPLAAADRDHADDEIRALRESVESLAARLRELERQPVPAAPGAPRPGLNLNKRSQALRMHRQGEPSDRIAAALELPRQEVELLLKVQQIVLANI
jgi:hypothetical protein